MSAPPPGQAQLWLARPDEIGDPALLARYVALLDQDERRTHGAFRFERDRHAYLVSHALTRTVLAAALGAAPEELVFRRGAHGKPELAEGALRFNASHTHGLVACLVATSEVGVDVEDGARNAELALADRYFSPAEAQALRQLPPAEQPARFFTLWTLKEAYLKARGLGLSLPLDRFGFTLGDDGAVALEVAAPHDDGRRWKLVPLRPTGRHFGAVAIEGPQLELVVRQVVPLADQTTS